MPEVLERIMAKVHVTEAGENMLRAGMPAASYQLAKTHCPSGHPYDDTNTHLTRQGHRLCRARHRIYRQRKRAAQ